MADDGASTRAPLELVDADVDGYCDTETGVCVLPDTAAPTADPVLEQPLIKETPMAIHRLNHAVLYIRDLDRSVEFYTKVLGFRVVFRMPEASFLQAGGSTNDHDLGLFQVGADAGGSGAGESTVGLFHLAWEVGTLTELKEIKNRLIEAGALVAETDHGTTKSLYAKDPDGLEFEVCWLVPAELLSGIQPEIAAPLDIDADMERFGAQTLSGVGVSRAVAV